MKSISKVFSVLMAVVLLSACGKGNQPENNVNPNGKTHEVTLTISNEAKAPNRVVIEDRTGDLKWEEGDVIAVMYDDWTVYPFELTEESTRGESSATFVGHIGENAFINHSPARVFFPYVDHKDASYYLDFEVSATQNNFEINGDVWYLNETGVQLSGDVYNVYPGCLSFTAEIGMENAAMLRIAAGDYTVKSEVVSGKTNYYADVVLNHYDFATKKYLTKNFRINNIDADGVGEEDYHAPLTFFVPSDNNGLQLPQFYVNDADEVWPLHTKWVSSYGERMPMVIYAGGRYNVSRYTWFMDAFLTENELKHFDGDNYKTMTWADYVALVNETRDPEYPFYEIAGDGKIRCASGAHEGEYITDKNGKEVTRDQYIRNRDGVFFHRSL